jgi:hypothetical protein
VISDHTVTARLQLRNKTATAKIGEASKLCCTVPDVCQNVPVLFDVVSDVHIPIVVIEFICGVSGGRAARYGRPENCTLVSTSTLAAHGE